MGTRKSMGAFRICTGCRGGEGSWVGSPIGEELGVGGVQVRVPSRRAIALTSGRCHRTRAGGRGAPRFGGKSRDSSRFEQQFLSYPPSVAQIAGHLGGIDGSRHADRDGDALSLIHI